MTKPKIKLGDLTDQSLEDRIRNAENRLYAMQEELARRERISRYGTETPDLHKFYIDVDMTFSVKVMATDEADVVAVVNETGWFEWYYTAPGGAVTVCDYEVRPGEPEPSLPDEELARIRANAIRRLDEMGFSTDLFH